MIMAYAIGHISGGHLHPAVSIGLGDGGTFRASESVLYIIAQVLGGAVAGGGIESAGCGTALQDLVCHYAEEDGGAHDGKIQGTVDA
jgi:hypothetical protein